MISTEAIDAALTAHTQWKKRLHDALKTGQSEFQVAVVKRDNACQFGQWLYGLSQEERNSDECKKVIELHAEFHKTAAEILDLALRGKKEEALTLLQFGGAYGIVSGRLVLALQAWKGKVKN